MNPIPEAYKSYIRQDLAALLPDGEVDTLISALETTEPSVAIRLNPLKTGSTGASGIAAMQMADCQVAWCPQGWHLSERPDFTHDPAMHQGRYYVQDASSMIISHIVGHLSRKINTTGPDGSGHTATADTPLRYLDACAAPGGKTTAAIAMLPARSLIVANEYDFRRAEILKENVIKWGAPRLVVSRGDTARFSALEDFFHIIAVDAPCSGEGMMRKDATARDQWQPALVDQCAARQREILTNLWPALAPGGYLIYSTCTFNRTENEQMLRWLSDTYHAETMEIPLPAGCEAIRVGERGSMRFFPHLVRGEGLFIAVVRKPGPAYPAVAALAAPRQKQARRQDGRTQPEMPEFPLLSRHLNIILPEANGEPEKPSKFVKAKPQKPAKSECAPTQAQALSVDLAPDAYPRIEVDLAMALAYLRRESLPHLEAPRGYVLLTYGGYPLGFVNNLPNRANNLYPLPWRILK